MFLRITGKTIYFKKTYEGGYLRKNLRGGGSRNESCASNCSDVARRRAARQSKVETDTFPIKKDRNKNIHFSSKYRSRKSVTIDFPLWFTTENSPKFPGNPPKIDGSRLPRAISQMCGNIFTSVLFLCLRLDLYFHFCCLLCLSDVWAITGVTFDSLTPPPSGGYLK